MNTKELTKNYTQKITAYLNHEAYKKNLLANCYVMCPCCGRLLPLFSKGCDSCLFQMKGEDSDRH